MLWADALMWASGDGGPVGWILLGCPPQVYVALPLLASLWAFRRKARGVAALGLTVALGQVFGPCGLCLGRPKDGARAFRVVSYNVETFAATPERVAAAIRAEDPDVFCLQEGFMDNYDRMKRPTAFMALLPEYRFFYERGQVIGSKRPILRPQTHTFASHGPMPHHWNVQEAAIEVDGREVRIVGVHMVPSGWQPADWPVLPFAASIERKRRMRDETVDEILRVVAAKETPIVVMGDFNMQPFGPRYRRLAGALTDAYRTTAFGFGLTIEPHLPFKRLDYVWTRGLTPLRTWNPADASDHRPVACDLALP